MILRKGIKETQFMPVLFFKSFYVFVYYSDPSLSSGIKISVCGWRSRTVILRSLIAKADRMHYLRIAGYAPDSPEIQGSNTEGYFNSE